MQQTISGRRMAIISVGGGGGGIMSRAARWGYHARIASARTFSAPRVEQVRACVVLFALALSRQRRSIAQNRVVAR